MQGILRTTDLFEQDLAFEIRSDEFKWKWEAYSLGPKVRTARLLKAIANEPLQTSADVISQQLVMPLISVTHMAFSSPDAVRDQDTGDLEKACLFRREPVHRVLHLVLWRQGSR